LVSHIPPSGVDDRHDIIGSGFGCVGAYHHINGDYSPHCVRIGVVFCGLPLALEGIAVIWYDYPNVTCIIIYDIYLPPIISESFVVYTATKKSLIVINGPSNLSNKCEAA
jgi:hypothetical protein